MIATSHPISTTFNFGIPARTCIEQTHLSNDVIESSSYAPVLSTSVKLKVEQIIKSLIKCFGHGVLNISNLPLFSDVIFWHLKKSTTIVANVEQENLPFFLHRPHTQVMHAYDLNFN